MKILYVTTVGITMGFFKSFIRELLDNGDTVDIACNDTDYKIPDCYKEWGCKIYHIDCNRNPLSKGTFSAIKQLKRIVSENKYELVHCHTPVAGACTRIACKKLRKQGVKVLYTAHGFHFYKGAPLKNWLIYYPIEKMCAHWTDVLITINKEDYALAQKKMKAKRVEYVPGVGIDVDKFANTVVDKVAKRNELSIPESAFLLLSVGELNKNKNHEVVIRALAELKNKDIHYAIAGKGQLQDYLVNLSKELGVENQVHLLGFRTDVAELYKSADCFVFPSFREGLSVAVMEAMASGLPCMVSKIRGNTDLILSEGGGYLCKPKDKKEFADPIKKLVEDATLRRKMSESNIKGIKDFDTMIVEQEMKEIYKNIISRE